MLSMRCQVLTCYALGRKLGEKLVHYIWYGKMVGWCRAGCVRDLATRRSSSEDYQWHQAYSERTSTPVRKWGRHRLPSCDITAHSVTLIHHFLPWLPIPDLGALCAGIYTALYASIPSECVFPQQILKL